MREAGREALAQDDVRRERVGTTLKRLSRTGALPTLPSVASAALALVRDPEVDVDELCELIQTDVGLAARVLRMANSAESGRRRKVRRLSDAVLTIGLRKTCDVLVAACARQLYDASSPHAEALWNHSLATAVACEELARFLNDEDPARAFLPGLFHDVGQIAFLLADRDSAVLLEGTVGADSGGRSGLECERYGFHHAEAGAMLAEDWGLAPEQTDAIRRHHEVGAGRNPADLATLVRAADRVAHGLGWGSGGHGPQTDPSPGGLDLSPGALDRLTADVCQRLAVHRALLF